MIKTPGGRCLKGEEMDQSVTSKNGFQRILHQNPWITPVLMVLPVLLVLAIFYFYPLFKLIPRSFVADGRIGFANYAKIFSEAAYVKSFAMTVAIAVMAVVITLLLGYPVAYLMATAKPKVQSFLMMLIMLSFWTSLMVRTYSWMVVLQKGGIVNSILLSLHIIKEPLTILYTPAAIVIGTVHILLPYMILPINSTLRGIDHNLAWAARSMGATRAQAFWKIIFPLSVPGISAGVLLVFVQALGFYVTPMLLGGGKTMVAATFIDRQMNTLANWGVGSAFGIVLTLVSVVFLLVYLRIFGTKSLKQGLF